VPLISIDKAVQNALHYLHAEQPFADRSLGNNPEIPHPAGEILNSL